VSSPIAVQGIGFQQGLELSRPWGVAHHLTVIISPSHLAHTMDKRTRANENSDFGAGLEFLKKNFQ
jgi:hypothetical protein